jgi:rubrerythrin
MSDFNESNNTNFEQTVGFLFRESARAEWQVRNLYLQFSDMFSHLPEVSNFWKDLAQDEEKHAKLLQTIQGNLSDNQLSQDADRDLMANIMQVLEDLGNVLPDSIYTLDDAYEVAHELEFSEINSVFKVLATEFVSDETRRETTLSHLGQHQRKLMEFTENIGDRTWRRGIAAKDFIHQQ